MTLNKAVEKLNELEKAAYALNHAQAVLYTDGDTVAPKNSWKGRGMALAYLGELMYKQLVNPETGEVLETVLQHKEETDEITFRRAEVMKEHYDDLHVLPMEEYVAFQELTNESSAVWHDAKVKSDWNMFAPFLEKIIAGRRRFASLKAPEKPAYDVLLDEYEKGAVMADLDPFFRTLREELSPLIREVAAREKPVPAFMKGPWPIADQRLFSEKIMALEGIDPMNCTLGETEHPFTNNTNKWDVRITTHYHEEDPFSSMFSVIHEGGHALYELDVRDDLQFTCLSGGVSMGVHESQSRFYENLIARSRAFCAPLLKIMKDVFPEQMKGVTEEELYSAVNLSKPSLIRTEADELTYSLHVMIRYELEKAMIAGGHRLLPQLRPGQRLRRPDAAGNGKDGGHMGHGREGRPRACDRLADGQDPSVRQSEKAAGPAARRHGRTPGRGGLYRVPEGEIRETVRDRRLILDKPGIIRYDAHPHACSICKPLSVKTTTAEAFYRFSGKGQPWNQ